MRSAHGSSGRSRDAEAPASFRPADEQRARLADQPGAERAALDHEPGCGVQVARRVPDEVAEQAERGALRGGASSCRPRPHDVGAARGVERRDDPRVREARERDRRAAQDSQHSSAAVPTNGTTCATVVSVHSRPRRSSRSPSARGRQ